MSVTFIDKNQTLEAPKGFMISSVDSRGSFLVVEYERKVFGPGPFPNTSYVAVFLNDQGREVGRTEWTEPLEPDQQTIPSGPETETQDWGGTAPGHIKAPNRFVAYLKLWWQCFRGVTKRRKS